MFSSKNSNFFMFLILICTLLTNIFLAVLTYFLPAFSDFKNIWLVQILGSTLYFLVPLVIYFGIKKISIREFLPLKKLCYKDVLSIIFLAFCIQPSLSLIGAVTNLFSKDEIGPVIELFSNLPFWQVFLTIAVFPAILEELIFRGAILSGFKKCSFWGGIFVSSLYFGFMHLTITQLFYATIGGIIFGFLVKVTGSIYASILAHFVLNGTQITLSYISINFSKMPEYESSEIMEISNIGLLIQSIWLFIMSLPLLILSVFLFIYVNKQSVINLRSEQALQSNRDKCITPFFFVTLVLYLVLLVLL